MQLDLEIEFRLALLRFSFSIENQTSSEFIRIDKGIDKGIELQLIISENKFYIRVFRK